MKNEFQFMRKRIRGMGLFPIHFNKDISLIMGFKEKAARAFRLMETANKVKIEDLKTKNKELSKEIEDLKARLKKAKNECIKTVEPIIKKLEKEYNELKEENNQLKEDVAREINQSI